MGEAPVQRNEVIGVDVSPADADRPSAPAVMSQPGGADQGFGRDASGPGAVAAEPFRNDQDPGPDRRCEVRRDKAGRATTDNDEVVLLEPRVARHVRMM